MHKVTWGMPIVLYLFSAGVAAGAFCFAALTSRRPGAGFAASARAAALLAPPALVFGLVMLILDLGYKIRFWFTMTAFNVVSPMSMGVWLLILFSLIATLYAVFWLPADLRRRIPLVGRWPLWDQEGLRNALGFAGIPLAALVAIYTGVLLSTTSIPLWRNTALPALFCFSALDTGFAGGVLMALLFSRGRRREIIAGPFHWLRESYRLLLPVYLVAAGVYLLLFFVPQGKQEVVLPLITGWRGLVWWLGVIGFGVLLPYAIDLLKAKATPAIIAIVLGAPLVGGFLLRLILVYTGQEYILASAYRLAFMP